MIARFKKLNITYKVFYLHMYNCIKGLRPVPWLKSPLPCYMVWIKNRNDTISASSILGAMDFYDFSVERVKQFCFSPLSICRSFKFFVGVMVLCACVQCVYSLDNNSVRIYSRPTSHGYGFQVFDFVCCAVL